MVGVLVSRKYLVFNNATSFDIFMKMFVFFTVIVSVLYTTNNMVHINIVVI